MLERICKLMNGYHDFSKESIPPHRQRTVADLEGGLRMTPSVPLRKKEVNKVFLVGGVEKESLE